MRTVLLGSTGLHVSALCFGTMTFGEDSDEATAAKVYARCRDAGITFFDCASYYAKGRSEEILGKLTEGHRGDVVLTTKFASHGMPDVNRTMASRRSIMQNVETSLRRLRTDYIDVLFAHRVDWDTPVEETVRALDDLVRQGKVLYAGASNWPAWKVMEAQGIARREGRTGLHVLQPLFNLLKRQVESELLPMAQAQGLGVISYSPIASGALSGKYAGGAQPSEGRFLTNQTHRERYADEQTGLAVERYIAFAKQQGVDPVSLAVAWVAAHPAISCPIIGARRPEQLDATLAALDIEMPRDLWQAISDLGADVPPATGRPGDVRALW